MNYTRVVPRDFFNEAKLLKCMGKLALMILDNKAPEGLKIDESGEPFNIVLLDEGSLTVINYPVFINETPVTFKTTYNSKENYPFYAEIDYTDYEVFNNDGEFTEEFLNLCKTLNN